MVLVTVTVTGNISFRVFICFEFLLKAGMCNLKHQNSYHYMKTMKT